MVRKSVCYSWKPIIYYLLMKTITETLCRLLLQLQNFPNKKNSFECETLFFTIKDHCNKQNSIHYLFFRRIIKHIDHLLRILQMSNSFANSFIYAKMHRYLYARHKRNSTTTTTTSDYFGQKRESLWSNLQFQGMKRSSSLWSNQLIEKNRKKDSIQSIEMPVTKNGHVE